MGTEIAQVGGGERQRHAQGDVVCSGGGEVGEVVRDGGEPERGGDRQGGGEGGDGECGELAGVCVGEEGEHLEQAAEQGGGQARGGGDGDCCRSCGTIYI